MSTRIQVRFERRAAYMNVGAKHPGLYSSAKRSFYERPATRRYTLLRPSVEGARTRAVPPAHPARRLFCTREG